jgi:hypothetical protein
MRFRRSKHVSELLIVLLSGLSPAVTTITTVLTRDWWRGSVKTVLMARTTGSRMTVVVKDGEVLAAVTGEVLASYFDVVSWAIPPGTPTRHVRAAPAVDPQRHPQADEPVRAGPAAAEQAQASRRSAADRPPGSKGAATTMTSRGTAATATPAGNAMAALHRG